MIPGFGQCGGEIYTCEGGEWVVDGSCEPEQTCEEPRPGCPSFGECNAGECLDIPVYECDETTGEWVDSGIICEGRLTDVIGDLYLVQSVSMAADSCPAMQPRKPLVLFVQDDYRVTATPPTTILEGEAFSGWGEGGVLARLVDDWAGAMPTIEYQLDVYEGGYVEGIANLTLGDCDAGLEVRGTLCPRGAEPCTVYDNGWNVWCSGDRVFSDDLTLYALCLPGTTDEVCQYGGYGNFERIATCPGACGDFDVHWFETVDEYNAFDPTTLCAP